MRLVAFFIDDELADPRPERLSDPIAEFYLAPGEDPTHWLPKVGAFLQVDTVEDPSGPNDDGRMEHGLRVQEIALGLSIDRRSGQTSLRYSVLLERRS